MKTIFTILFLAIISFTASSQGNQSDVSQKAVNDITSNTAAYRLFPTKNMWNFIKLNTRNGEMWQVQFDVQGDNRFVTYLSLSRLTTLDTEANGRFTLYPTDNIHTLILLDQVDGRTWQVQWSLEAENRVIVPIE